MDGPSDDHTKWIKSDIARWILYDIPCLWNLKYDSNELTYKTETDSDIENRLVITKGAGDGEGWSGRLGLADVSFDIENG